MNPLNSNSSDHTTQKYNASESNQYNLHGVHLNKTDQSINQLSKSKKHYLTHEHDNNQPFSKKITLEKQNNNFLTEDNSFLDDIKTSNYPLENLVIDADFDINSPFNVTHLESSNELISKQSILDMISQKHPIKGSEIKAIREYFNLSIHKFASQISSSDTTISDAEEFNTNLNIQLEKLLRLAIFLKLNKNPTEFKKFYRNISKIHLDNTQNEIHLSFEKKSTVKSIIKTEISKNSYLNKSDIESIINIFNITEEEFAIIIGTVKSVVKKWLFAKSDKRSPAYEKLIRLFVFAELSKSDDKFLTFFEKLIIMKFKN